MYHDFGAAPSGEPIFDRQPANGMRLERNQPVAGASWGWRIRNTSLYVALAGAGPHIIIGRRTGAVGDLWLDSTTIVGSAAVSATALSALVSALGNNSSSLSIGQFGFVDRAMTDVECARLVWYAGAKYKFAVT